jgi:hypothetical protein
VKKISVFLRKYSEDLYMFAGLLAILIGSSRVNGTLAWFVCGVECLAVAYLLAKSKGSK